MAVPQISAEELKIARDVLVGVAGVLVAAVGFLIRIAYKMGKDAEKVAIAIATITEIKTSVELIPVLVSRIGTVEEAWHTTRSDIRHLLRGSRPDEHEKDSP